MELGQSSIRGVLSGNKQYRIPLFQRPYSWEKAEWLVLFMDVLDQYRIVSEVFAKDPDEDSRNQQLQGIPAHYLGTLVQADPSAVGMSRVKLIDGQQRLSTISIAICALRDHWMRAGGLGSAESAASLDYKFIVNPGESGDGKYRLLPQARDRRAYQAITDVAREYKLLKATDHGLGVSDSASMFKAYNFFLRAFETSPKQLQGYGSLYPLNPEALLVALVDRLYSVTIEAVSNTDNVNAIFESLNTKGRALRQVDLLKNFIFLTLGAEADRVIRDHWMPIESLLSPTDLEHYVWAFTLADGNNVLQNRTYEALQRRLRGQPDAVEDLVVSLKSSAALFESILNPAKESKPELRRTFLDLHSAGGVVWIPVALYCYRRFVNEKHGLDDFIDALRRVESFLVRRMLCDLAPNNLNSMFGIMLARLHTPEFAPTESLSEDIGRVLASKPGDWPTDSEMRARIGATDFYHRQKAPQRIHVLRRLDATYNGSGATPDYEISDRSIEHIAPQSADAPAWKTDLQTEDLKELHDQLLHTLGNLTLVTPAMNSSLGTKGWREKRLTYADAGYPMTVALATLDVETWGPSEVRARSAELADRAIEVWPRSAVAPHPVADESEMSDAEADAAPEGSEATDDELVSDAELDEGWAAIQAEHELDEAETS